MCTIRPFPLYSQRRQIINEISIVIMQMFIVNLSVKVFQNWKLWNWTQTWTDLNFKVSKRIWLTNYWFMNDLLSCLFFSIKKNWLLRNSCKKKFIFWWNIQEIIIILKLVETCEGTDISQSWIERNCFTKLFFSPISWPIITEEDSFHLRHTVGLFKYLTCDH